MLPLLLRSRAPWCGCIVAFIILFCAAPNASALDPHKSISQYGLDVWLRQNGLPANAVNVAVQAQKGEIWLGTAAGLFRFDGARFDEVTTEIGGGDTRESIPALIEGKDGSLWVGTGFNHLCRILNGAILRYGDQEGIMGRNVVALMASREGEVWAGTSYGLYRFREGRFSAVPVQPSFVTGLAEDRRGRIWVGTHAGVRIFRGDTLVDSFPAVIRSAERLVTTLYADRDGAVWVGTYEGLLRWRDGSITTYTAADGLSDDHVTALCEDRDGNLWVGTNNGGVNRLCGGHWSACTTRDGLSNNHVLSIMEDLEGSVWVCTLDGLNRLKDVDLTTITTKEGLTSDYISSVIEGRDGAMYFFSPETSSITRWKGRSATTIAAPVGPACLTADGTLWIGQTGSLVALHGDRVTRYGRQNGFPSKWISAIAEDDHSLILYMNDVGLKRLVGGRLEPYLLPDGEEFTPDVYVACMYYDSSGVLWIGTTRQLIAVRNGKPCTLLPPGWAGDYWVSSLYDDHLGSMWIGSPHAGLARFRNGAFTLYTTQCGLFTDEIYSVLGDDKGDLWLGSPRGIGYVKRSSLEAYAEGRKGKVEMQVFATADGMKTDECFGGWQPAAWKARDGRLWFATKKGVVVVDPGSLRRNELPPPVSIEQVVADQQSIPLNSPVRFSAGTGKFEFHYTALSFLVPERVLFKYQLEGYDRGWVEPGTRRVAYYTNLPPGDYRFHVIACNNDGVWNETGASLEFTLAPRFYQTYWFYGVFACAATLIIVGIYRLRVRRLKAHEAQLERLVAERTNELQAQRAFLRKVIDLIPSFIFAKDEEGRFTLANRSLADAYGATAEILVGKADADFNLKREEVVKFRHDDRQVLESGAEKFIPEEEFTDNAGERHWMQVTKIPIAPEGSGVRQLLGVATDITGRKEAEERLKASLHEKEVLLKEIHHRVKNNLQVISSLLRLQADQMEDERLKQALAECQNRVRSMALIHENLYRSHNLANINFAEYLGTVTNELVRSFGKSEVSASFDVEPIVIPIDTAIPCGLIVNELLTNALKHAFVGRERGAVAVTLRHRGEDRAEFSVRDDGIGFPRHGEVRSLKSMGMTLVLSLTDQINGTLTVESNGGTTFRVTFPLKPA